MTCSGSPCTGHSQSTVSHHTCTSSPSRQRSSCLPGTPRSSSCRCQHPRSGNGSLRTTSRRYNLLQPLRFQQTRLSSGQSCTPCRTTSSRISRRSGLPDTCIRSVRSTEGMGRLTCSGSPCTGHSQSTVSHHTCTSSPSRQRSSCLPGTPRSSSCRCQHPRSGNGSLRTTSRDYAASSVPTSFVCQSGATVSRRWFAGHVHSVSAEQEGMSKLTCSGSPCTGHSQSTVSHHTCTSSTSRRARRACRARLAVVLDPASKVR